MSNVVTIKADDSNMRETTDIVDKLNKLFDGTSLVAEIVTKETRSMNGKTSYESYIKIEKGDWMEIIISCILSAVISIVVSVAICYVAMMIHFKNIDNALEDVLGLIDRKKEDYKWSIC